MLDGAFKAMVVMQETYGMDPVDFSNGIVMENRGVERLDVDDLMDAANVAANYNFIGQALFLNAWIRGFDNVMRCLGFSKGPRGLL